MKCYYYAHTGHRIGLDRFRRAAAIIGTLDDASITLLSSDFRIAHIAKEYGIEECVGIDVVRNIANIAKNGDQLLFDSQEANPLMLEDMRRYFSTFIRVSDGENDIKANDELLISPYVAGDEICNCYIVDKKFFSQKEKEIKMSFFFGDDDYEEDLVKNLDFIEGLEIHLQLGFYYFLDYEDLLKRKFAHYFEFEEYEEMIFKSDILITASPQAVLESLASGGRPIFFKRADYSDDFDALFKTLNIPIIADYNKEQLLEIIATIDNIKYQNIEDNSNKMKEYLKASLNL